MKDKTRSKLIVIGLMLGLLQPAPVWAGNGKKQYKLGQALEAEKKFDQAAETYLIALGEEPDNIEYRIGYQRAATQASVMLVRRGREALELGQYEEAYNAFRRAYQFDKTNELAKDLAARALDLQRKVEGLAPVPVTQTPYGATPPLVVASRQSPVASGTAVTSDQRPATSDQLAPEKDKVRENIIFPNRDLEEMIRHLAQRLGLNVMFDTTFRSRKVNIELRNVTLAQALDSILRSNNLFFEPDNENTIIVAVDNTANRARLQQMSVQTFYLKNSDEQTVQTIQTSLNALFGQRVMVFPNAQLRSLTVRTTPETLKLVGSIIQALDKDKPEVLIDVSIYEVSRTDLLEIGNQLLFDGFFQNPPQGAIRPGTLNTLGVTAGQIITEQRLALSIPTSIIRMLQTRGNSRLIDSLQVHALDGKQVTANVGQRIPIQTASLPSSFATVQPNQPQQPNQNVQDRVLNSLSLGVPQIEYQDVGLNIEVTPTIYSDDDVKLEMNIETSGVAAGPTSLTPIFTQRRLKSEATVQTGQAAMMAGVMQRRQETNRTSLPIIGFLPVIGRFFSVPTDRTNTTDLIITVTPHIIRSADIREEDRLAMSSGLQLMGVSESVETFLEKRSLVASRSSLVEKQSLVASRSSLVEKQSLVASRSSLVEQPLPATSDQRPATNSPATSDQLASEGATHAREADGAESTSVVSLQLQPNTLQPQAGGSLSVALLWNSHQLLQAANLVLRFNPSVLRVKKVVGSGQWTVDSGQPHDLRLGSSKIQNEASGSLLITMKVTQQNASGSMGVWAYERVGEGSPTPNSLSQTPTQSEAPLAVIEFDVVGPGESALAVVADASFFIKPDGRQLHCVSTPVAISAK